MHKMDPLTDFFQERRQHACISCSQRTGTETYAIEGPIDLLQDFVEIFSSRSNSGKSKYGKWRIIRVNGHLDAFCFANLLDTFQKITQIVQQSLLTDCLINVNALMEVS